MLHFLGPFLSNLSQLPETRSLILARDAVTISRLLTYTDYKGKNIFEIFRESDIFATFSKFLDFIKL